MQNSLSLKILFITKTLIQYFFIIVVNSHKTKTYRTNNSNNLCFNFKMPKVTLYPTLLHSAFFIFSSKWYSYFASSSHQTTLFSTKRFYNTPKIQNETWGLNKEYKQYSWKRTGFSHILKSEFPIKKRLYQQMFEQFKAIQNNFQPVHFSYCFCFKSNPVWVPVKAGRRVTFHSADLCSIFHLKLVYIGFDRKGTMHDNISIYHLANTSLWERVPI